MNITEDQLNQLGELADKVVNLISATQLAMPPELSTKIKTLVVEVSGENPWEA